MLSLVSSPSGLEAGEIASSKSKMTEDAACPSRDFAAFLSTFSEQANVQRRFTLLPLKFREYDDDLKLKTRVISSFEAIPTFSAEFGGAVFGNSRQRRSQKLKIEISKERKAISTRRRW
jgi:hypothetical protein